MSDVVRVLVLAGGDSAERDVSLESGACVAAALRDRGHDVRVLDPTAEAIPLSAAADSDVAFPVVHGAGGEDGILQAALQNIGLTYVGSSPAASALTFDKIRANEFLARCGVRVPGSVVVCRSQSTSEQFALIDTLGAFETGADGVVTKPPRQGSSIGVSIVRRRADLPIALERAFEHDERCLVERYIVGREITVPVVDGVAFPAVEIQTGGEWYDYDAKYVDDRTQYIVNPADGSATAQQTAVQSCRLCGVEGIARVDFRVDPNGEAWLLEINTVPGMTSHSLVPKSAAAMGQSLGELCENAIRTRLGAADGTVAAEQ